MVRRDEPSPPPMVGADEPSPPPMVRRDEPSPPPMVGALPEADGFNGIIFVDFLAGTASCDPDALSAFLLLDFDPLTFLDVLPDLSSSGEDGARFFLFLGTLLSSGIFAVLAFGAGHETGSIKSVDECFFGSEMAAMNLSSRSKNLSSSVPLLCSRCLLKKNHTAKLCRNTSFASKRSFSTKTT